MATSRYVALTPIRHNGKLFAVGDALALTDAQAASLGSAIAPQAGALPAMPPDPPVPVLATPSGSGVEPRGIAPSGSVAIDGTITLGTALPIAFPQIMLYLPAGAIAGSQAGLYAVEMSSPTVGVVREKFGGSALIGSGSAYSGVVAETEMTRSTISWGELASGRNTRLRVQGLCNNTAGTKTYRARVGSIVGTQITSAGPASNKGFAPEVAVRGLGSSFIFGGASGVTGGTNSAELLSVTPGQDVVVVHSLQLSAATDWALIVDVGQVIE